MSVSTENPSKYDARVQDYELDTKTFRRRLSAPFAALAVTLAVSLMFVAGLNTITTSSEIEDIVFLTGEISATDSE